MSDKEKKIKEHLKVNKSNYILLLFGIFVIALFSPHGIIKSVFTGIVLYIFTFLIGNMNRFMKPLADFITKAGTTRLYNSELLGMGCTLGWLAWLFGVNYLLHRYTGVQALDPFIILFWAILYFSVHGINFLMFHKSKNGGRELTGLLDIITKKNAKITTMGKPKLNIIFSTVSLLVDGLQ